MGQTGLAFAFLFENFLVCIVDRLAIALLFSIRKEGGGGEEGFLLGYFWTKVKNKYFYHTDRKV